MNLPATSFQPDFSMKKTILLSASLLLLLISCGKKGTPETAETPVDSAIPIKTFVVGQQNGSLPISANGMIMSSSEERLSFKIPGVISRMLVDEGDVVRSGQLLATLDLTEVNAQVSQATRAVEKAARDLVRVENLRRDSAATLELLQNATTARDLARENLTIASFNQKFAEIRAVRGGKVIKKSMNQGEVAGPGIPVFVIMGSGPADWVAKISLSDRDWARLSLGQTAKVTVDAFPETTFSGKISDLSPAADPANGLYSVEIQINPNGKRFAPGLFAQAEIQPTASSKRSLPVVPIESIVEGDGREAFVFSLNKDGATVEKRAIRVAFLDGKMAVVASGLEGVTEVVSVGSPYLTDGAQVRKM